MIHPSAIVHPSARVARTAEIGPFCLIGENVAIGQEAKLLAHVVINGHTTIGDEATIYPFASIGAPSQDRKAADEIAYTTIGPRTVVRGIRVDPSGDGRRSNDGGQQRLPAARLRAHRAHCTIGNSVTMSNLAQLAGHCTVEITR